MLPLYRGAIAQYYDLVSSQNINAMLIDFTQKFLEEKSYTEDSIVFKVPQDTVWSTLKGGLDSNFITPFVFFGSGYIPFNYSFEHEVLTNGSARLRVFFRNKKAWDKVECEFIYKNKNIISANIKCIWDMELQSSNSYSCTMNSLGLMKVSTSTLREFEERLKRILPYLK